MGLTLSEPCCRGGCRGRSRPRDAARIAAVQLAGERGYTESLGALRRLIDSPHTETVLKIAAIGALGKLGGAGDLPRLERLRASAPERLVPALDSAIERLSKSKN